MRMGRLLGWCIFPLITTAVINVDVQPIADRPVTWDAPGAVPVFSAPPDHRVSSLFALMREGEYFRAYVSAKSYLSKHPDSAVDAWIMVESARKRGNHDELLADAKRMQLKNSTPVHKILLLRSVNLALLREFHLRPSDQAKIRLLEREEERTLPAVEALAPTDLAALAACLGSYKGDIGRNRELARAYVKAHPDALEGAVLFARSLIKGRVGSSIEPGPGGKKGPLRSLGGDEGPKIDEGLRVLDVAEKRFGRDPRMVFYRAQGLALAADIADPKVADVQVLHRGAREAASSFVKIGKPYPRLLACAEKYLSNGRSSAFFPLPDE